MRTIRVFEDVPLNDGANDWLATVAVAQIEGGPNTIASFMAVRSDCTVYTGVAEVGNAADDERICVRNAVVSWFVDHALHQGDITSVWMAWRNKMRARARLIADVESPPSSMPDPAIAGQTAAIIASCGKAVKHDEC